MVLVDYADQTTCFISNLFWLLTSLMPEVVGRVVSIRLIRHYKTLVQHCSRTTLKLVLQRFDQARLWSENGFSRPKKRTLHTQFALTRTIPPCT